MAKEKGHSQLVKELFRSMCEENMEANPNGKKLKYNIKCSLLFLFSCKEVLICDILKGIKGFRGLILRLNWGSVLMCN